MHKIQPKTESQFLRLTHDQIKGLRIAVGKRLLATGESLTVPGLIRSLVDEFLDNEGRVHQ